MIRSTDKVNEDTIRFIFDKDISDYVADFSAEQKSYTSPLAKKLFGFPWTQALKIAPQYIELTKQSWVDWDILLEPLKGLLEEHFTAFPKETKPVIKNLGSLPDTEEVQQILQFIKDSINPALSSHGGWLELKNFENNTASIFMGGGCQGCGMSAMTLKEGIETQLKGNFPFVHQVVDVTDHSSGSNPYFSH